MRVGVGAARGELTAKTEMAHGTSNTKLRLGNRSGRSMPMSPCFESPVTPADYLQYAADSRVYT